TEHPEAADAQARELRLLEQLQQAAHGAVALVSGRSLEQLDRMFAPLVLPAAGQHGFEWRNVRGERHRRRFPADKLRAAAGALREFAAAHEGVVFEDKGASVSLHYRLAPHLREAAHEAVLRAAAA